MSFDHKPTATTKCSVVVNPTEAFRIPVSLPERNASAKVKRLLHQRQINLRLILLEVGVFLGLFVVTLLLQRASGAHSAALGAEPDEASHYATGVMVHDYFVRGLPGNPLTFAKEFYIHYPRVAFGLWPPLFHLCSGVWMLAFGTGRMSIMVMLAALTAIWAWLLYRTIGTPTCWSATQPNLHISSYD
jgi:hypothetical protein